MRSRESPKRKTNTDNPLDSVILELDHVNGVRRSRDNEVMDQWKYMMINSLLGINISIYTPMKC